VALKKVRREKRNMMLEKTRQVIGTATWGMEII
jgi:hypothetical protein